jgi:YHS domain-containing protein
MSNQTVHDPVCHMDITIESAAGTSDYDGMTYYFCSRGCKVDFDADPAGVLEAEAAYDHDQPADESMMAMPTATAAGEPKKPWWQFWR